MTKPPQVDSTRRLILLGRSNAGTKQFLPEFLIIDSFLVKDTFAKVLLALENDCMINQNSSSTRRLDECSHVIDSRNFHGTILTVVNTPSLDNRASLSTIKKKEIARSLELVPPGPHAFVFVLEFTPDSLPSEEDDKQLLDLLIDIFGSDIFQYVVFVFTNLERLKAIGMGVDRYMETRCSQAFIDLMERCKKRRVPFNNNAPSNAQDASIAVLMLTINQIHKENGEKVYRDDSRWREQASTYTTEM